MFKRSAAPSPHRPRTACLCANTTWYVANFRARLIESLLSQGWRVVVFAPVDRHVERVLALGALHVPMRLDNTSTAIGTELATLISIRRRLHEMSPDVVLTWTPKVNLYATLAAASLDVPSLVNISGLGRASGAGGWVSLATRLMYRLALGWPGTVFFQNEEDRDAFVRQRLVEPGRVRLLPGSGVDIDRFAPTPAARGRPFRFLLVARLLWAKGIGEFAEAARRVRARRPDVEFAMAGFFVDGDAGVPRSRVEDWEREGVLRYLGSFDDMVPIYREADCVVLPSYYREGVPRSLLEAASMGVPVITTDSVGCRDTVEDGRSGYLVPPRDVDALVDRMLAMVEAPEEDRAAMGRAARRLACERFDERRVIEAYRDAIGRAVGDADASDRVAPQASAKRSGRRDTAREREGQDA